MELLDCLKKAVEAGASDLFIVVGAHISMKKGNQIIPLSEERLRRPDEAAALIHEIYTKANRKPDRLENLGDDDFSFAIPGLSRFRVNTYRQRGSLSAVVRIVTFDIPDWKTLGIPEQVMNLAKLRHGMVLFTGTAGSGKSTTQACIIDRINHDQTHRSHIITLEDPIEYLYTDDQSIISQREISLDTENYISALRACLRQAPDVILLGEMRDQETIQTAITAAETGHLLIATLHTKGAANAIGRIVDTFPSGQQGQIRTQLSMVLQAVVSQQLLPGIHVDDKPVPAFEIMHGTTAIRSQIRDGKVHLLNNTMLSASGEQVPLQERMITMDQSILKLYEAGRITAETALEFADNPDSMKSKLK